MGSCFSSSAVAAANADSSACCSNAPPTAKVVAPDGSLREFAHAIKVHEVLGRDRPSSFLCSSDELHYDASIPPLAAQATLQPGQLYFLLPASMLGYRLTGADMAELASKAVSALGRSPAAAPPKQINYKKGRGRIRSMSIQVMPVAELEEAPEAASACSDANLNTIRSFQDVRAAYDGKKNGNSSRSNSRGPATFRLGKRVLRSNNAQKLGTIEEVAE